MIYCNNKNMYSCIYDILINNKLINNIYYFWNNFDSIYNNNYDKIRAKKNWYRLKLRYNTSKIIIDKFDKNNYLKFIYFNSNTNNLTDNDWEIVFT